MTIDEIRDNFALLDEWDDRYRYVIELGRTLDPMPEAEHSAANKVQGCASQVWLSKRLDRSDAGEPLLKYLGDSDAHIVRGLVAILLTLYSGHTPQQILATDATRGVRRIRISRAFDAAAFQWLARHGRAHPFRRTRGVGRRVVELSAISAAGAAGPIPSSWRVANAPPRSLARPWGNRAEGSICRGIAPASCCIACADDASAI